MSKKYSIQEVHSKVLPLRDKTKVEFDGKKTKMSSERYHLFKEKGVKCVCCGINGSYYKLDEGSPNHLGQPTYHFNLYAVDEKGNEVLMTKDHIMPKSKGGKNCLSNYQTMCTHCNKEKGNKIS